MRREDTPEEAAFRQEVRSWLEANAELRSEQLAAPLDHSPEAEARAWEAMKVWQRRLESRLRSLFNAASSPVRPSGVCHTVFGVGGGKAVA